MGSCKCRVNFRDPYNTMFSALCGPTTCALKINERMSKIHDSSNKVELRFTFIS